MIKLVCSSLLIIFCTCLFAQDYISKDYSHIDSIAKNTKKKHRHVDELTDVLVSGLTEPDEKVRVIYTWISYHIEYKDEKYGTDAEKILKKEIGVCEGYSALFDAMCSRAGISSSVVTGYSKTKTTEIGKKYSKADHAWNAVYMNNKWYFIDATWGAGSYDEKEKEFTQTFEDAFFLASPGFFNLSHFAEDSMWAKISQQTSTVKEFYKTPLFYPAYTNFPNMLCDTAPGIIQVRNIDTVRIHLCEPPENISFGYYIKSGRKIGTAELLNENGQYFLVVPLKKRVSTTLTIFYDKEPLFDIKLKNS